MLVPPEINHPAPGGLLVVGRDVDGYAAEEGRVFTGQAGQILDECLSEIGLTRREVNLAVVVGHQPPGNEFAAHNPQNVLEGAESLRTLARWLRPKLILAMGNEASYALLEGVQNPITRVSGWPTKGKGVFGAKDIEERRGYFWDSPYGKVLTTLYPVGILNRGVPGDFLIRCDFRRAKRFLNGTLPVDTFPAYKRLDNPKAFTELRRSSVVGWDIETKWDNTAQLCEAMCGDDSQPYLILNRRELDYAHSILQSGTPIGGHNGIFDLTGKRLFYGIKVKNYAHDSQHMWGSLEPELAGQDEDEDSSIEGVKQSRMTRKGLAFLWSIYGGVTAWWKDYPDNQDPEHLEKMMVLNGNDAFSTRHLLGWLYNEIIKEDVLGQYKQKMDLFPYLLESHLRGLTINETLRKERFDALETRFEAAKEISEKAGLEYIREHDLAAFRDLRQCDCCGGGKVSAQHCWRCGGLPKKPEKKADYLAPKDHKYTGTVKDLRERLPACTRCGGAGRLTSHHFNPYSRNQLVKLLYDELRVPKSVFKNKEMMDQEALKKILKWSRGG